jgi:hypothetical protein
MGSGTGRNGQNERKWIFRGSRGEGVYGNYGIPTHNIPEEGLTLEYCVFLP